MHNRTQWSLGCAIVIAVVAAAKIDPEAWKIVDDKLYLNYSRKIQKKWKKEQAANINKGTRTGPRF
jgi:hypothetical protein